MKLFNELTQHGSVIESTESDNHITFKILRWGKPFSLSYFFTNDGWDYEIADKFDTVIDGGQYARIA